jgi:integrase
VGRVYKPTVYKPLPEAVELFTRKGQRFAKWRDRRGRTRTAPVVLPKRGKHKGELRLVVRSNIYWAEYRGADGLHSVSTGCRDESAARGVLRELERRAELVKGNLLTAAEARTADHRAAPLAGHFAAFEIYLSGRASSAMHRRNVMSRLRRLAADCGFQTLADLKRPKLEAWVAAAPESMAARTRNGYINALSSFCNSAVAAGRLGANPFARFHRANERADQRRPRRAMTTEELGRLLRAAQRRPLAEYGREVMPLETGSHTPKRASWTYRPVTADTLAECEARARERLSRKHPERIAEAEAEGRLRALTYKTLALTGLRLNELRSLTVGAVDLDGPAPVAVLRAADEKSRRGAEIPLRLDLARELAPTPGRPAENRTAGRTTRRTAYSCAVARRPTTASRA